MAKQVSQQKSNADNDLAASQPIVENRLVTLAALLTLLLAMVFAMLVPRMTGDTFFTISGGRDTFDGKLAQPDEWAFTTEDRIWINQSWGTGVVFYQLWKLTGFAGLVMYKAVLIAMTGLFLVLAGRQLGATWAVAMLAAAFTIDAGHYFIDIRANLFGITLLAALVWVLFRSQGHRHRIWLAVAITTLWAQVHGSFIFGVAMIGWWAVAHFAVCYLSGWRGNQLKQMWPLFVAALLAPIMAAVTSPFGLQNVIQPFTLMGFEAKKWPMPSSEMLPIFGGEDTLYGGTLWFLFILGCLIAPLVLLCVHRRTGPRSATPVDPGQRIKLVFILILTAITVVMTLQARRFTMVSLIVCTPLLAYGFQQMFDRRQFAWIAPLAIVSAAQIGELLMLGTSFALVGPTGVITRAAVIDERVTWGIVALALVLSPLLAAAVARIWGARWKEYLDGNPRMSAWFARWTTPQRRGWAPLILAIALSLVLTVQIANQLPWFQKNHPVMPACDTFGRLVYLMSFPEDGVRFLSDNQISGRVLNDWRWEGFLHWHHPQLKLMLGGRSRQVYSADSAIAYQKAQLTLDYADHLAQEIGLVITPASLDAPMGKRAFLDSTSPLRLIYFDGRTLITANQNIPWSQQLIVDEAAGKLVWPTVMSEKYTIAAQHLSLTSGNTGEEIMQACREAAAEHPTQILYHLLYINMTANRVPPQQVVVFFESELERLQDEDYHRPMGIDVLESRQFLASRLAEIYARGGSSNSGRVQFWQDYARQSADTAREAVGLSAHQAPVLGQVLSLVVDGLTGNRAAQSGPDRIPSEYLPRDFGPGG